MTSEQKGAAIFFMVVFISMGVFIGLIGARYIEEPVVVKHYCDCRCECEPPIDFMLWPEEIKWTISQPAESVYNFFVPGGPEAPDREAREDMER